MIAARPEQNRVRIEIEKIESSDCEPQFKRLQIGRLLHDLSKFAGHEYAVELIHEMNLQVKYNFTLLKTG